ncbi:hypothetical protein IGI04_024174 [Brassica rapa subsp. trilocularis]|uniref:Uncharacterized protein n=1 Tax=Brassica rapa subsp. trilocularis TaxID=1813537 RepID=A0ABQ7M8D4_BRACM|nr:hypothetical protein IGI04_024174 [Brassica rapa subsp. trilocularis]
MDSARPPGSSETAPATRKVQEGSQQGSAGLENGQKRQEGAPSKSWVGVATEKKVLRKYSVEADTNEGEAVKDINGLEEQHKRGVEKQILTEGDKEVAGKDDAAGKMAAEEEIVVEDEAEEVAMDEGEIEEGEVVKGWSRVSPGKTSRSPTATTPKYGQERIATPSRFSALNDADDNGDLVINISDSNRGETVVEEDDEGTTTEDNQEGKELGERILNEEEKENTSSETAVIEDQEWEQF